MTAHAPGPAAAVRLRVRRPAALQTTTMDDDRRQRAKQHWPIGRVSNKAQHWQTNRATLCVTANVLSTKEDAQCDKLAVVEEVDKNAYAALCGAR